MLSLSEHTYCSFEYQPAAWDCVGEHIVEAFGGIGRRGARCLRFLARRAKDRKRGRDGTRYSRFHSANYLSHHMMRIVSAAVFANAEHICDGIVGLKQRAYDLAQADTRAT